jgi:hypothetical protein
MGSTKLKPIVYDADDEGVWFGSFDAAVEKCGRETQDATIPGCGR